MNTNPDLAKTFFYAMSDAQEYDATIRLTVPYYDLEIKTLIDILNYHFGVAIDGKKPEDIDGIFLDVGAGTGMESMSILKAFTNTKALAVDIAQPMKHAFEENYRTNFPDTQKQGFHYVLDDIMNFEKEKHNLPDEYLNSKKIAAISGFCIHHFDLAGKEKIYKKMYDFLDDGGILINIDLFNYESVAVSKYAHHFDLDYIEREFNNPSADYNSSHNIPGELRSELKSKWLYHMNHDNVLDSVESQIKILKKIGFKNTECIFRYFQQGILVATK